MDYAKIVHWPTLIATVGVVIVILLVVKIAGRNNQ